MSVPPQFVASPAVVTPSSAIGLEILCDTGLSFHFAVITVEFTDSQGLMWEEPVWDYANGFYGRYSGAANTSSKSEGGDSATLTILRDGGWNDSPTFRLYALDSDNNLVSGVA